MKHSIDFEDRAGRIVVGQDIKWPQKGWWFSFNHSPGLQVYARNYGRVDGDWWVVAAPEYMIFEHSEDDTSYTTP